MNDLDIHDRSDAIGQYRRDDRPVDGEIETALPHRPLARRWRGPISRPSRACAREAETIAPAHSSRTAATGPDYGSAGRPPHIFGVPGPPAPILAPVSLMSEKSKRNLVKPRSRPFRSGWSPPSAGLSGSRGFSRAAIRACRRLRPEVGREAVRNEWAGAMVSASRAHARLGREIGPGLDRTAGVDPNRVFVRCSDACRF